MQKHGTDRQVLLNDNRNSQRYAIVMYTFHMPSILVFGSNKENRNKKVNSILQNVDLNEDENNPDLLTIKKQDDKGSLGIKQIREAISFLTKRPFSHKNKAVVIKDADLLTVQAQNALLKTLEEHPDYAYIILSTKTEDVLLETVISRCKRIKVHELDEIKELEINVDEVLSDSKGERLTRVNNLAKKDTSDILLLLEGWINQLRQNLGKSNPSNTAKNIERINKVLQDLEQTNINTKLALEKLFLELE